MTAAVFKATYSDFKLVKTRGVVQVIFEVPLHDSDAAYKVLGGMPDAATERWFGIARLTAVPQAAQAREPNSAPPARGRKSWDEMSPAQQAGILCADKSFQKFLRVKDELAATERIRFSLNVTSRRHIPDDSPEWRELVSRYRTWQLAAQVVPA
jgi:hypothetical protein